MYESFLRPNESPLSTRPLDVERSSSGRHERSVRRSNTIHDIMTEILRKRELPPDEHPTASEGFPAPSLPEFGRFREVVDNPHSYARAWTERNDGPIVAFFSTDVPREVLYAAGMLPIRPYGGRNPDDLVVGDEHHFRKLCCPFSRDVLSQGLLDRYEYVDGAVLAGYCFHMRQTYRGWVNEVAGDDAFTHYFVTPHGTQAEGGDEFLPRKRGAVETTAPENSTCPHAPAEYLAAKFEELKAAVEEYVGGEITDDDLREAIDVYDRNRTLLRELYAYRAAERPRLSGLEAMEAVKAGQLMDPREHNALLERALDRLRDGEGRARDADYRLMLITAANDDRTLVRRIEEDIAFDATLVIEESDVGSRDFWNTVAEPGGPSWYGRETDPLTDVARRYAARPPHPSKDWERRSDHLRSLVDEFDVDGALIVQEERCDLHNRDVPLEKRLLEEDMDVPTLTLVSDESGLPTGQLTTRVEAFVEGLETEALEGLF